MGGTDDSENLIELTPREHYIAHWMLWKTYRNKSMTHAFWMMNCMQSKSITSKVYQTLREERNKVMSESMVGNEYGKNNKGYKKTQTHIDNHRASMVEYYKNRSTTENQKKSVIEANKKRKGTNPTDAAVNATKKKVSIDGVVYESVAEAQRQLGIKNLFRLLRSEKVPYKNWYYL